MRLQPDGHAPILPILVLLQDFDMHKPIAILAILLLLGCSDPRVVAKSRNTSGDILVLSDRKCTLPRTVSLLRYHVTYHTDKGPRTGCWEDGGMTFLIQAEGEHIELISKDDFYFYPSLP